VYYPLLFLLLFGGMAHYRHHGPALLNDLSVTPGAITEMTTAQLCDPKFHTGSVRDVSESTKKQVCAEYGIAPEDCSGEHVEIDHLISIELGGGEGPSNLWPEPYLPEPGAKTKDILENTLHRLVCRGDISLHEAQREIRTDWYAEYLKLGLDKHIKLGTFADRTQ